MGLQKGVLTYQSFVARAVRRFHRGDVRDLQRDNDTALLNRAHYSGCILHMHCLPATGGERVARAQKGGWRMAVNETETEACKCSRAAVKLKRT